MPVTVVRTPHDEQLWEQAKARAAEDGVTEKAGDTYWKYVMGIFKRSKGSESKFSDRMRDGITDTVTPPGFAKSIRQYLRSDPLEILAEQEHDQWMSWTKAVADKVSPAQRAKWAKNWRPYAELSDDEKDEDRVWARRALVRLDALAKSMQTFSAPSKQGEPEPFEPKGTLKANARPAPVLDSHALVQRPDHPKALAGRVVSVGQHGIHLRTDDGNLHKVRNEHVLDHQPPISAQEWPEAARALHRQGVQPIDVEERFRKPVAETGKPSIPAGAAQLLQTLEQQGVPIDSKKLLEEGTPEEVMELLSRYVNLDPKPSQMPTVVGQSKMSEAPGWDHVFPQGRGRVSKQKTAPKREFAEDNDSARDESYDACLATKMVARIELSDEVEPDDQEHLLRVAAKTLTALADVVEPLAQPPLLVIEPNDTGDEETSDRGDSVGAHYDRRGRRLVVGMGLPESIVHAYGHAVDADFGGGKYASLDPESDIGPLVEKLGQSPAVMSLGKDIDGAPFEEDADKDKAKRFWSSRPEVFARFFEQWVGHVAERDGGDDHHRYVSGVESPGQHDEKDLVSLDRLFTALMGSRDRSRSLAIRKRTAASSEDQAGQLARPDKHPDDTSEDDRHRRVLLEEAKKHGGPVGRHIEAAVAHGIHPRHIIAKRYDTPEQANDHQVIVGRVRDRLKA